MRCVAAIGGAARRLALAERRPLAHPEAMLLVDHRDRQLVEAHVVLDQRVGAHDQRQLAAGELAEDVAPASRGC